MQLSFDTNSQEIFLLSEKKIIENVIIDRKSKYHVTGIPIQDISEVKQKIKNLKKDTLFGKATHNSYAYRYKSEMGILEEGKNDDGETGAGNCILREMQRVNAQNMILIVTRYFGGIHLQADRFKNVIDACKIFFETQKKK